MTGVLAGRVALITGAARGIGLATARRLSDDGAALVLVDLDEEPLAAAAAPLAAAGGQVRAIVGSPSDPEVAGAAVEAAQALGGLDVLVNNAGTTVDRMFHRMDLDAFEAVLDANLRTAWVMTRAAVDVMRGTAKAEIDAVGAPARCRKVIMTSSVAALTGNPGQANYTAAKGALVSLTRTLALELGPFGITVNAVAPGFIDTRLTASKSADDPLGIPDDVRRGILSMIALGRFGRPEDVANVHAFLASPDSDFVSGVTLPVTGGQFGGMG